MMAPTEQALIRRVNFALTDGAKASRPGGECGAAAPFDIRSDTLFASAEEGLLLAQLVHHTDADAIDERALNVRGVEGGAQLSVAQKLQNHTLVSNAATSIGCGVTHLGAEQLLHARQHQQAHKRRSLLSVHPAPPRTHTHPFALTTLAQQCS